MKLFSRLFPADLQPNGYDIIRTWDYYLLVRGIILFGKPQFKTALINGMVRGTDGRMMHKSYGNYVEAREVIEKYGADALRQWAYASGSTGSDIPFRWEDVDYGWRFLLKLWNASRFVSFHIKDHEIKLPQKLSIIDKWLLSKLEKLTRDVTKAMEEFQFNVALESIRQFFWHVFCDHYIEAVKHRLYQEANPESKEAARYTLYEALFRFLQLLAPFTPHIVEEIYQRIYARNKGYKSIHVTPWPSFNEKMVDDEAEDKGGSIIWTIAELRRLKANMGIPLSATVEKAVIYTEKYADVIEEYLEDIKAVVRIKELRLVRKPLEEGIEVRGYPEIRVKIFT